MRVTDEVWAAQVKRADDAELALAKALAAIELVLREHDDCLCRHARRILGPQIGLAEVTQYRVTSGTRRTDPGSGPITVADGTRGMERGR